MADFLFSSLTSLPCAIANRDIAILIGTSHIQRWRQRLQVQSRSSWIISSFEFNQPIFLILRLYWIWHIISNFVLSLL